MRVVAFLLATVAVFFVLVLGWLGLIVATGGSFTECDRGDCGSLGEFSVNTSPLMPLVFLSIAPVAAWAVVGRSSRR